MVATLALFPVSDRPTSIADPSPNRAKGFFAGMRIRQKLLVLHTVFILGLAAILLASLRPAVGTIVERAEESKALAVLNLIALQHGSGISPPVEPTEPGITIRRGPATDLNLNTEFATRLALAPLEAQRNAAPKDDRTHAAVFLPARLSTQTPIYYTAAVMIPEAREAVTRLYILLTVALLAVYVLVAASLEIFVLPKHVYRPIRQALRADLAIQAGRPDEEIIPEHLLPADELGEVMRSRNESILALRKYQSALAETLTQLETVANDLKRKNHLLETAQRNLADADRLASLGMMSAGIAHELNTPLAVLKGSVEQLTRQPGAGLDPARGALMLRVIRRLERLSESLLDFARVRPPEWHTVPLRSITEEATTLVRLDREAADIEVLDSTPPDLAVRCDPDRIVQVLVNLLRNAVDAIRSAHGPRPDHSPRQILIASELVCREGRSWISLTIADTGPGIDPAILPRLFEPFASTRLDSKGTGLGLAVADGIVREHGGLILAGNRADRTGASFEVMLPINTPDPASEPQP